MRQRTYGGVGSPAREGGLTRLGEAAYCWGNFVPLLSFSRFHKGYFWGKLTAFSDKKYYYDSDKAAKDLTSAFRENEWFKDDGFSREEAKELLDKVIYIYHEYSDPEIAFGAAQRNTDLATISDLYECRLYDCGKSPHYWLMCHYVGLQLAIEQLQKRGILPTPKEDAAS